MGLFGTKKDDAPQPAAVDAQQQLLSYGALLAKVNGNTPESLAMPKTFRFDPAGLLRKAWDVSAADEARERIEWLLVAGHRSEADDAFAAYQAGDTTMLPKPTWKLLDSMKKVMAGATMRGDKMTKERLASTTSILAWDLERAAFVARLAYNAGYLSETETWEVLRRVQATTRENLPDWLEYLMSYVFGRAIVMTDTDAGAMLTMFHTGHSLGYMKKGIWYLNPIR